MLAALVSVPEVMLAAEEAKAMGEAAAAVAAYYSPDFDPKWMAWGNLLLVTGGIYGTRAIAFSARKKSEAAARRPAVAEFPGAAQARQQQQKANGAPAAAAGPRTPADMFGMDYSFATAVSSD